MAEPNKYLEMSDAELERQKNLLEQALAAKDACVDVAAVVALKWAMKRLKDRGKLGAGWDAISPQMMRKEGLMGKPAGYSESEISAIEKNVLAAIEAAARKR